MFKLRGDDLGDDLEANKLLAALLGTPTAEVAGRDTFSRFRYQTKVAVMHWLMCLDDGGPVAVVCEHVEDLGVVWPDRVELMQVKTRAHTRSAWTFASIIGDGGGLDSCARAYWLTKDTIDSTELCLRLWLQGGQSAKAPMPSFCVDPTSLDPVYHSKLLKCARVATQPFRSGRDQFTHDDLQSWLSMLRIDTGCASGQMADKNIVFGLMARLSTTPVSDVWELAEALLERAAQAQSGELPIGTLVGEARGGGAFDADSPLSAQILGKAELLKLLPNDPALSQAHLAALKNAAALSTMEQKLLLNGATDNTRKNAKRARVAAQLEVQKLLAQGIVATRELEDLTDELIAYASHVALLHSQGVASPADAIFSWLYVNEAQWSHLDQAGIFSSTPRGLLGLLCDASDHCRFPWRAA